METITFESMPSKLAEIDRKLNVLLDAFDNPRAKEDYLMPIEQLREYLPETPARQTIYQWVNDRTIPFEKFGRRLYFRKSAIDKWMQNGRRI
ncbi:MAG: helix-turn-helix domain-containing protein [Bacteroidales bacterium]|nr:helix-turn-helix domain-containing protein [Bacteroidales bacterium]